MPSPSFANLSLGPACPPSGFGPEQSALVAGHLEAQQLTRFGAFAVGAGIPPLLVPSLLQQQPPQMPASPFAVPLPGSPTTPVWPVPGPGPFSAPSQSQSQSQNAASPEALLGAVASMLCRRWNSTPDGNAGSCCVPETAQDLTLAQPPPYQPPSTAAAALPPSTLRALSLDPSAFPALRPLAPHEAATTHPTPTRPMSTQHESAPLSVPVPLSFPLSLSSLPFPLQLQLLSLRALLPLASQLPPDLQACARQAATVASATVPSTECSSSVGVGVAFPLPPLAHMHVHTGAPPLQPQPHPQPTDTPSLSSASAADLCAGHQQQQQQLSPNGALAMPIPMQDWQRHLLALLTGGSFARPNN